MKLILIGFMASGKSSVAQALSKQLDLPVIEVDELAVKESGLKSIAEIFAKLGEDRFRALESGVIAGLAGLQAGVISPGGGSIVTSGNVANLRKNGGIFVYLKTSFETVEARAGKGALKGEAARPLFKEGAAARKLYDARLHIYENLADVTVETDGKTVAQVAAAVQTALKKKGG